MQHNTNKSKDKAVLPFLHALEGKDCSLIAIQEPWLNPAKSDTLEVGAYYTVLPEGPRPRTCFYVSKDLDPTAWKSTVHSTDMITISLTIGDTTINVHNCYNPPPGSYTSQSPGTLPLIKIALAMPGEHILLGDFNLYHPQWDGVGCPTQHDMADTLIETTLVAGPRPTTASRHYYKKNQQQRKYNWPCICNKTHSGESPPLQH